MRLGRIIYHLLSTWQKLGKIKKDSVISLIGTVTAYEHQLVFILVSKHMS